MSPANSHLETDPNLDNIFAGMDDDEFVLYGWERLTRHKFGSEGQTKVQESRDKLSEIGTDEMRKFTWAGLQDGTEEDSIEFG